MSPGGRLLAWGEVDIFRDWLGGIFSFFWLVAAGRRGRDLGVGQVLTVLGRLLQTS